MTEYNTNPNPLNDLIRDADTKPSKARAWEMLAALIESGAVEQSDPNTRARLVGLVGHFKPAAPKKPRTVFDWVAQAVAGKDDPREYMRHVYCDGTHIVATDGYRAHFAPKPGGVVMRKGYYDPKTAVPVDVGPEYPDTSRITRHMENPQPWPDNPVEFALPGVKGRGPLIGIELGGHTYNQEYMQQALNHPDGLPSAHEPGSPLQMEWPDGSLAVLMDLRV